MTEIRFYHLQSQSLEQALPGLLAKALQTGQNILVKTPDKRSAEHLNEILWTYDPNSFLPHGTEKDGHTDKQPIFITDQDENPNQADILILTYGTSLETIKDYKLCCEIFDGRSNEALQTARTKWKAYKNQGEEDLTYWQQTPQGGWEKKT